MGLVAQPQYIFGGVDTRSNPANRPNDRALRCRNWIPTEAGYLKLREGYAAETQDVVTAAFIHSLEEYKQWNGTRYQLLVHGTTLKRRNLATGAVTTIGTLASSADCEFAIADNKAFIVNGTDQKFYDGTTLRTIGIAQPTDAQIELTSVREVLRSPTSTEDNVTVGQNAAGGSFPATTSTGIQLYMHYLDVTAGYGHGPAAAIGSRTVFAAGTTNRFVLTTVPNLSGVNTNWKKIFSRTEDGTSIAKFCASASISVSDLSINHTTRVVTATSTAHGWSVGDVFEMRIVGWEGVFTVASTPTADTFTYKDLLTRGDVADSAGTAYKLVVCDNAATAIDITGTTTGNLQANAECGLAESTIGGEQPGYQLYASFYNATVDHSGNRKIIQGRISPGTAGTRAIFFVQALTDLSAVDTEYSWLIGRTGDGADVPYVIADSAGNWKYLNNAWTSFVVRDAGVDGAAPLPTTNDIPSGLVQVERVGDRLYGRKASSPYVFYTPSERDDRTGNFVGMPTQCWPSDLFETFPTADATVCIAEYDHQLLVFTESDSAVLVETLGEIGWQGPYNVGIIGPRAFTRVAKGRFSGGYWVTADRQLAMTSAEGPVIISEEYENGLLSRIGDSYKTDTEICYQRKHGVDRLVIKCKDSTGAPFIVYHDFRLADERSPLGQGYEAVYVGALASDFTLFQGRDTSGNAQVYAGATNGRIYKLDSTGQDAGTDFTAEYIALINLGEDRVSNPWEQWYGDQQVKVYHGKTLNSTLTQLQDDSYRLESQSVPGGSTSFKWAVSRAADGVENPQYFRFVLTSHPSDALVDGAASASDPMALNTVPQLPIEDYGRVYAVKVALADRMGA